MFGVVLDCKWDNSVAHQFLQKKWHIGQLERLAGIPI